MPDAALRLSQESAGPIRLLAPSTGEQHTTGTHGEMWQWVGDGGDLISLIVAVRRTRLGTSSGVRQHLTWEFDRLQRTFDPDIAASRQGPEFRPIRGATAVAIGTLTGVRSGIRIHNSVVVTTDRTWMHVIHIMTPDTNRGRSFATTVGDSVEVSDWEGRS